jgi:hypothetical protein
MDRAFRTAIALHAHSTTEMYRCLYASVKPQCVGLNYDELIQVQPHAECFT